MKDKKFKVLHITQVTGGVQTYLEQIFDNIDYNKFELALACPPDKKSLINNAIEKGCCYFPLEMEWNISPIKDAISVYNIIKLVKEYKPDLIHAHSSKAGMLGRIAGLFIKQPVVFTPHAYAFLGKSGPKRSALLWIEKIAALFTESVLATSNSEAHRTINDVGLSQSKVSVFRNSIEILELPEVQTNEEHNTPVILTVGRLVEQKNPLMFLKVCKETLQYTKNIRFKMIGAGFEDKIQEKVEAYIQENKLENHVEIISWIDREDLFQEISKCSIFVMTSLFESFGYVVAEAQMLGIPVVATKVDGFVEIIDDGITGHLIESNDYKGMTDKLMKLINNPTSAKSMGIKGRERIIKYFSTKSNIHTLESFYLSTSKETIY